MRAVGLVLVIWITTLAAGLGLSACSEEPIGQPCTFRWPVDQKVDPPVTNCEDFPACAPLQKTSAVGMGDTPQNDACPVDCIQIPSLECTNLICVATQVDEASDRMNGQCSADMSHDECPGAGYGCMGYCTKECLSDASCPKGYRCARMAPFGENLRCDDEALWGDGGGDTGLQCTDSCTSTGPIPDTVLTCPGSVEGEADYNYSLCDDKDYAKCCACMCYRFCPLLTKKFCRKISWDEDVFPLGQSTRQDCAND